MKSACLLALVGVVCLCASSLFAAPAQPTDRMLQQEQKQQQLKVTTQRVASQLNAIIEEFQRNAIDGEDVKVLRAIGGVLGRLSEKDMEKVIAFLQQSRSSEDPNASTRKATDAYASQKSIIIQLQQLVLEYQRQQALYELSLRFKEYAARQTANMWLAVSLADETEKKTIGNPAPTLGSFSEPQQSSLRVQQIDQETLKDEIALTLGKLEQIAKEVTDGPNSDRPKLALQQAQDGKLKPSLDSAIEDLKTGKLRSASGNEQRARDQLREIARILLLSQGEMEALRQALHEIEQTIEQQKALTEDTRKVEKDDLKKIQPRQAEIVDGTDMIRRDIESLAPIASDQLENAIDRMQEARKTLSDEKDPKKQREKAPPKQEEAIANLEQARRTLMEELAKAEQFAQTPQNALEELKEIQEQVRELIKDEEQVKKETAETKPKDLPSKAPRQGELKDTAQELQQAASAKSPTAAQSINEAASQMQKAQNSMASSQNNPAAQQAAIDALQRAEQQLGQDIAQLEQAQKELAAIEEMMQKLQAIIEEQQKVHVSTSKEAVKAEKSPLNELSGRQEKVGSETGALQKESSVPVPTAAAHLGKAQNQMGQAKSQLDKPEAAGAQPRQEGALKDLYAAQREFEKRMNELRDQLGMAPMDNAQSLADAQALIEQAKRDVDQAMSELQQAPPGLLDALQQQQQQIAESLAEMSKNSPSVNNAGQNAKDAAQRLNQGSLPQAAAAMKAAQDAMRQSSAQFSQLPGRDRKSGKPVYRADGGRYNPATDSWNAISTTGAPAARANMASVWTGRELIVWGGEGTNGVPLADGARYSPERRGPERDGWTPLAPSPLAARLEPTAVWTGTEMIIYGGVKFEGNRWISFADGARYNPANNTWKPLSQRGSPGPRTAHTAVWTGTEMLVWGGCWQPEGRFLNSGFAYDPATDAWSPMGLSASLPGRGYHAAVWTGSEMIVWGGQVNLNPATQANTGARYNPETGAWRSVTAERAPVARMFWRPDAGVWAGNAMFVFGGWDGEELASASLYSPSNGWLQCASGPSARFGHSAVFADGKVIVWGGGAQSTWLKDGAIYAGANNTWTSVSSKDGPSERGFHAAVWTGSEMIVWGGRADEPSDAPTGLPALAKQQSDVLRATEALLSTLRKASQKSLQQAERSLENAGSAISPLTTGKFGPLPPNIQSPLQSAQDAMADGSAQASGGQGQPAHSSSHSAGKSLEQALAALALAQAGLGSQMAQGQGQQPGQGQAQGQGQQPGQGQGRGTPPPQGNGRQGNWDGSGGTEGARRNDAGASSYIGLPKRDRAAIIQSQSEKYPQEYGPLVEQYLKNLADQPAEK